MKQTLLLALALAVAFFLDILQSSTFAQRGERTYGWKGYETAESIQQTKDGGYIVAGYTSSSFDA